MITRINSSNADKYTILFKKATQALVEAQIAAEANNDTIGIVYQKDEETGEPLLNEEGLYISEDPINTIEKYFFYLPKLAVLGGATDKNIYNVLHSEGRRYTMLPVFITADEKAAGVDSECLFEINADTRKINIPTEFNANGASVQGDKFAETLYFSIDRFYDAMDLDTADIYIQWTKPNGESGVSIPWVVDIESIPNKIIFGWALSSTITELPGNLQFAIRFYRWGDDSHTKLSYSLSTLTHTVTVKPALDFKLGLDDYIDEIDVNDEIVSRINQSHTVVTENEDAKEPIFVFNMEDLAALEEHDDIAYYNPTDKTIYIDLEDNESQEILVQAKSLDSGMLTYDWSFITIDGVEGIHGNAGTDGDESHSVKDIVFIETKDVTPLSTKIYYERKEKDGVVSYIAVNPSSLEGGEETPVSKGWFEKFARLTVNQVGTFYATVSNSKPRTNPATLDSDYATVPMPILPYIVPVEDGEEDNDLRESYILPTDINEERKVTLSIKAGNAEQNGTHNGVLSYKWFMKNEAEDEFREVVLLDENEEPKDLNYPNLTLEFDSSKSDKEVEGYYKVEITNSKNKESLSIESREGRLSYPAESPIIVYPERQEKITSYFVNQELNPEAYAKSFTVKLNEAWLSKWNISDEIQYQWIQTGDDVLESDPSVVNPERTDDRFMSDENGDGVGANTPTFIPVKPGNYYCLVTNVKNGTTARAVSGIISTV